MLEMLETLGIFLGGNANKTCFMRAVCVYQVCFCFRTNRGNEMEFPFFLVLR